MGASQRIAIVWDHPSRLVDCSFRFEQYVQGFRELELEPVVVCSRSSAEGFTGPVTIAESSASLADDAFWRASGAKVVVAITWHRMASLLGAARRAGAWTISIADTDGRVGLLSHPWATLERSLAYASGPGARLQCAARWLFRYALERRRGSLEDAEYLASTESSDAVVLGNREAKREFSRFLERSGRGELDQRVFVVPFTLAAPYLATEIRSERRDRVVAIGRWDDPQKDARLLARTLSTYLGNRAQSEVLVVGNATRTLRDLASRLPSVELLGLVEPDRLAEILGAGRTMLFSSRWEGSPHAGFEALAMGLTVVGPPIPFVRACADEGFGTVAADRRPSSLAQALRLERSAWESGQRAAVTIAATWRRRLEPKAVCRAMLETVGWPSVSRG